MVERPEAEDHWLPGLPAGGPEVSNRGEPLIKALAWLSLMSVRAKQASRIGSARATAAGAVVLGLSALGWSIEGAAAQEAAKGASGLPIPRFVSLKSEPVNMRQGPGTEYAAAWVYRRAGLPLEIVKEFEAWRQVRDAEGATGWVLQSFLSRRRTALLLPWEVKPGVQPPRVALRTSDSERAGAVAQIEAGVIGNVHGCDGRWCDVSIEKYRGYIEQNKLWGVYPSEIVK